MINYYKLKRGWVILTLWSNRVEQMKGQGWPFETAFAAMEPLSNLQNRAEDAAVVVFVLAPGHANAEGLDDVQVGGSSVAGGGNHEHLEQLIWYLLGRKKV